MITPSSLISLSKEHMFTIGNYKILSQDPTVLSSAQRAYVVPNFLPQFIEFWHDLEKVTGHRWKCTSYLRQSASHSRGHAIDFAPAIAPSARKDYAVYNGSDPVLYKRAPLVHALQKLKNKRYGPKNSLGVFLEPDHLHVQILSNLGTQHPLSVVKWGIPKPIYGDTYKRMALPATNKGY